MILEVMSDKLMILLLATLGVFVFIVFGTILTIVITTNVNKPKDDKKKKKDKNKGDQ